MFEQLLKHVAVDFLQGREWWYQLHTFPGLCMVAGGSLKGVGMIRVVVASLSIEWHRHTGGYRLWGIPMGQLPGTVVILRAQDSFNQLQNSVLAIPTC